MQIISLLHRRFSKEFTSVLISLLSTAIGAPSRASLSGLTAEQKEKEDGARVLRQRPVLRICSELALVGVIRDGPEKSGGEWIMKAIKELVGGAWFRYFILLTLIVSFQTTQVYPHYPFSSPFLNHILDLFLVSCRQPPSNKILLPLNLDPFRLLNPLLATMPYTFHPS